MRILFASSLTMRGAWKKRGFAAVWVMFLFAAVFALAFSLDVDKNDDVSIGARENYNISGTHRKLLVKPSMATREPDRIRGENCTRADIVINQGPTPPLPNGIPTYTVEIMNVCFSGCDISRIHLTCGWFSSVRLINPKVFKRLRYNDCLVNDGKPLTNGGTLSFQYANTFLYPLSVSSVVCS